MNCTVYRVANGRLVLVPDCMHAFMTVEATLGALTHCGTIETDLLAPALAHEIETQIDDRFYAVCPPDLALRFGYRVDAMIDLPPDFRWEEADFWEQGDAVSLACVLDAPVVVASAVPGPHGGFRASINEHKPWGFRGGMVTISRAAAMQYLALWAQGNAEKLRCEIVTSRLAEPDARPVERAPASP